MTLRCSLCLAAHRGSLDGVVATQQNKTGLAPRDSIVLVEGLKLAPRQIRSSQFPWPGKRAAEVVADIAGCVPKAHFNFHRCKALAAACCSALASVASDAVRLKNDDPIAYSRFMAELLDALEVITTSGLLCVFRGEGGGGGGGLQGRPWGQGGMDIG